MPLAFVNVPNLPGVPPVFRDPAAAVTSGLQFMTKDAIANFGYSSAAGAAWGVYKSGKAVVKFDTFVSIEYRQDWAIADYPIERGSFASYDKVDIPYDVRCKFAAGGSEDNRRALLTSVAAMAETLDLYDVVTPEAVYTSCNVQHYDYRRTATNGVGMIQVDLWLLEIRTTSAIGQNTQSASGALQQNGGHVAPTDANLAQNNVWTSGAPAIPYTSVGGVSTVAA